MNRYRIEGGHIVVPAGNSVELTQEQAARRAHLLEGGKLAKRHPAVYTLTGETHFKAGEEIGWSGDVPKAWSHLLVDLEAATKRAAAEEAARQEKEARAEAARRQSALIDAIKNVKPTDDKGNVDAAKLDEAIKAAKLDFTPTDEQLQTAWDDVAQARATESAK